MSFERNPHLLHLLCGFLILFRLSMKYFRTEINLRASKKGIFHFQRIFRLSLSLRLGILVLRQNASCCDLRGTEPFLSKINEKSAWACKNICWMLLFVDLIVSLSCTKSRNTCTKSSTDKEFLKRMKADHVGQNRKRTNFAKIKNLRLN